MKKKTLSLVVAFALCAAVCVPVCAMAAYSAYNGPSHEIQERAYMDMEQASPEMQQSILEARKEIVNNTDWVADGYTGYIQNVETGEIIKELPQFSELFPGWDIPVEDITPVDESKTQIIIEENSLNIMPLDIGVSPDEWIRLASARHYLQSADATENAEPFAVFTVDPFEMGTQIRAYATSLSSSETCNIGISDYDTGESLGLGTRLIENYAVVVYVGVSEPTVAIRASTYSTPGWATMAIDGGYRAINVK